MSFIGLHSSEVKQLSHVQLFVTPVDCSLPGSSVHGIFQARVLEWVAISFSRDLPDPGIEPRSPALQEDSLPTELSGKPNLLVTSKTISLFQSTCNCKTNLLFMSRLSQSLLSATKRAILRKWQPTPVLLPGKFHGRRSLVGYSPWGRKSRTRLSD